MKKINSFLALILAVIMVVAVMPFNVTATSNALKGKTVVCFGDSLTAMGNPAYPSYLSNLLGADVEVVNSGVGGDTTYLGYARFQKDVLDKNPDVVLICFGMNDQAYDLVYNSNFMSIEYYEYYLRYFAETLQARGVDVIFITPHPVLDASGYYNSEASINEGYNYNHPGQMDKYCKVMRQLAVEYGCDLIDINYEFNLLKANNYNTYKSYYAVNDGVHQNQTGRQVWANYISAYLHAKYDGVNKAAMTVKCVDEKGRTVKNVNYVGAKGANITIVPPVLGAFTTNDSQITTSFVNGKTFTFKYTSKIDSVLEQIENIDYTQYCETILSQIRKEYINAKNLLSADEIDFDAVLKCYENLNKYLETKGEIDFVLSQGKPYDAPEADYRQWDNTTQSNSGPLVEKYIDDGIRLTDGVMSNANYETKEYSVWVSNAEIIVDMGASVKANAFSAYFASYQPYGINVPNTIKVYVSDNKTNWTEIKAQVVKTALTNTDGWNSHKLRIRTDSLVSGRYFKFVVERQGSFAWINEVEVSLANPVASNGIALGNDINAYSTAPNLDNKDNIVAKWDTDKGAYLIESVNANVSDLADDEIILVAGENSALSNAKAGQYLALYGVEEKLASYFVVADSKDQLNVAMEENVALNKSYTVSGGGKGYEYTDPTWGYASYQAKLTDGIASDSLDYNDDWFGVYQGPNGTPNVVNGVCTFVIDLGKNYDLSKVTAHFRNDNGPGIFAPTSVKVSVAKDGSDTYTSAGTFGDINTDDSVIYWSGTSIDCVGRYVKIEIGTTSTFVFLNEIQVFGKEPAKQAVLPAAPKDEGSDDDDNSNPEISNPDVSDNTSNEENSSEEVSNEDISNDVSNEDISNDDTSNETSSENNESSEDTSNDTSDDTFDDISDDISDDTSKDDVSDDENKDEEKPDNISLGDINGNNKIDMTDYILLKRAYFGTYNFTEAQKKTGDINGNNKIDMTDYILVKRMYFGTYKVK